MYIYIDRTGCLNFLPATSTWAEKSPGWLIYVAYHLHRLGVTSTNTSLQFTHWQCISKPILMYNVHKLCSWHVTPWRRDLWVNSLKLDPGDPHHQKLSFHQLSWDWKMFLIWNSCPLTSATRLPPVWWRWNLRSATDGMRDARTFLGWNPLRVDNLWREPKAGTAGPWRKINSWLLAYKFLLDNDQGDYMAREVLDVDMFQGMCTHKRVKIHYLSVYPYVNTSEFDSVWCGGRWDHRDARGGAIGGNRFRPFNLP